MGAAAPLAADRGLRLCFPGAAGQAAGWEQNGVFHLITTVLSADSQAAGDALPPGGDGYCAAGGDLIVWTKHLTRFVTYATVAVPAARAGGPYSGRAGAGLILDGSGSATPAGALVSYEWDLNGDGVYDVWSDPANPAASLAVPWSVLSAVCALPINGSGGSYTGTVTLRISDSAGRTATDTAALVILPAEPAVRLQWRLPAGAAEVNPGDTFTLELTAEGVPELAGLAWELTYDPGTLAILTPAAPVAPGEPAAAWLPAENSAGAGTPAVLRFTAVSGGPGQDLVLPTVLASVTFHALQPGSLDFSFTGPAAAVKLSLSGPGGVPIGYTPTGTTLVIVSRGALLAADADGSGAVDFADLVRVALAYGSARSQPGYPAACDLNADGVVDIYDLVRVARAMV